MAMAAVGGIRKKKSKQLSRDAHFSSKLNSFSKCKDLHAALSLYSEALADGDHLSQHQLNTLLYICSTSLTNPSVKDVAIEYGYEIFQKMESSGVKPNEASVTAMVRMASARGDGDYAFQLVRGMGAWNLEPRLRTYSPVLLCFCERLEADKAYDVESHMGTMGISLEETELAGLLKVSSLTNREARVYEYLQKLRVVVGCVQEETLKVIADWFERFNGKNIALDSGVVRDALSRNGGGWHGLGWVGEGRWVIQRGLINEFGSCCVCGHQLVGVDIDESERDQFAASVANLALEREVISNFCEFQNWLDEHPDYDAIVDGANVGLYQQNFAEGGFSVPQLDAVVKELSDKRNKKPLIILHSRRVRALLEDSTNRLLVDEWIKNDTLYTTPQGSNDDWYWLYAAVKLNCYLVTNDEMRDHIFELLGPKFFVKWKERHQIRYTSVKGDLKLVMPSPFSLTIQEGETGSWHFPVVSNGESAPLWLCASRRSNQEMLAQLAPRNG